MIGFSTHSRSSSRCINGRGLDVFNGRGQMSHTSCNGSFYGVYEWCSTGFPSRVRSRHFDAWAWYPRIIMKPITPLIFTFFHPESSLGIKGLHTCAIIVEAAPLYILFLPSIYQSFHLPVTNKQNGQQLIFSCWHSCTIVSNHKRLVFLETDLCTQKHPWLE